MLPTGILISFPVGVQTRESPAAWRPRLSGRRSVDVEERLRRGMRLDLGNQGRRKKLRAKPANTTSVEEGPLPAMPDCHGCRVIQSHRSVVGITDNNTGGLDGVLQDGLPNKRKGRLEGRPILSPDSSLLGPELIHRQVPLYRNLDQGNRERRNASGRGHRVHFVNARERGRGGKILTPQSFAYCIQLLCILQREIR